MIIDKFRSVQKFTKPILKIFKKFCKTDRQTYTQTDRKTGSPVEVPPELKKCKNISKFALFADSTLNFMQTRTKLRSCEAIDV